MTHSDRQLAEAQRRAAIDDAIKECRAMPIEDVAEKIGLDMEQASGWLSGPCPNCGGEDRFNIKTEDGGFFCRKGCGAKGAGAIDLVMLVKGLTFMEAVRDLHGGDLPERIDPAEQERRERAREKSRRERERKKAQHRQRAIGDARRIWDRARGHGTGPVREYLARRGITPALLPDLPDCLRFLPDHPYVLRRKVDGVMQNVTLHRGPAMIAAILAPEGHLTCVHQTWFDLDRPMGKALIAWQGEKEPNKLTRGSQSRAAIRLVTPERFDTLVMAEGIETTLTAAVAWRAALGPDVAYWAGISLGHMAGKRARKRPGQRFSDMPDMADPDGFYPPPWVKRLIFVQDGDSEAESTRAQLLSGLRRAMARNPGLACQIVHAGDGVDLNDVLVGRGAKAVENIEEEKP